MARNRYDSGYRGYDRAYFPRELPMGPGWSWDDQADPNYRGGEYHGMRMHADGRHTAAYGEQRFYRQGDLGGSGGFDGRYDLPEGRFDREGYYHEAWEGHGAPPEPRWAGRPPRDEGPRMRYDGGVRYDIDYLRQYNSASPALGHGPHRSWGYAPGPDAPTMRHVDSRGQRTDERGYAGYNRGGFAEGKFPGPGTRDSNPARRGRG